MRLRRAISAAWKELARSSELSDSYLDLDPTPTPDEEKQGFKDPRLMIGPIESLNLTNLQADIKRKKWFTGFSYFIASLWTAFLMTVTLLRAARAWLNWPQDALAKNASVGVSTVRDFEAGRRQPTRNNLAAMQVVLEEAGVSFSDDTRSSGISVSK
jgi:DNA-binding transcriptional regulator YiaG